MVFLIAVCKPIHIIITLNEWVEWVDERKFKIETKVETETDKRKFILKGKKLYTTC